MDALALHLTDGAHGVDLFYLDAFEDGFKRLLDLSLVGIDGYFEYVALFLDAVVALFGQDGAKDDIMSILHQAYTS